MYQTHPLTAPASTDLLIAFAGYERAVLCARTGHLPFAQSGSVSLHQCPASHGC